MEEQVSGFNIGTAAGDFKIFQQLQQPKLSAMHGIPPTASKEVVLV
jgi:hypothetical protein